jgi:hypothetical protein
MAVSTMGAAKPLTRLPIAANKHVPFTLTFAVPPWQCDCGRVLSASMLSFISRPHAPLPAIVPLVMVSNRPPEISMPTPVAMLLA